jgi:CheY-like chemotaxis protein
MDGVTGIDAAIRISEMVPHCRVILFSGQAATADLLERAKASGHRFELLIKPVHPRALLERLSRPN